ncbi:MAG: biopolymer transporter ExbD [Rhodobacteraceae bacterium]|nr:biopolymer transporter ExbD [Paracoccaceae bacterium]
MRFSVPTRRPRAESIVPMINVVFLLLIFFLMSADLRAPPPVDVHLPDADVALAQLPPGALYAAADGTLAFGPSRGAAALQAAVAGGTVVLRADRDLPGADLARLLARLAALGATEVRLVTEAG